MSSKKKPSQGNTPNPTIRDAVNAEPSNPAATATTIAPTYDNPLLRKVFYASLLAMLVTFLISGYNVGFHTDEMDMNNYCKANVAYYTSGGKDTTFMGLPATDETKIESILRFYGTAFEYVPVIFNKVTGLDKGAGEFNSRHVFIQIFGVLALLFSGLIARKLGGWRTALFTIWLLFLTPAFFGGTLFNSKDIPFCTGYLATLYFIIQFLEELPSPSWKTSLCLMASFAFTTGTRIGGLLLIFSLGLFMLVYTISQTGMLAKAIGNIKQLIFKLAAIIGGGLALVVVTWPYVLRDPMNNLTTTLTVVKKFPMKIPLNFEGIFTDSLSIPVYYLPKFILITVPIFILAAILLGIFIAFTKKKQYDWKLTSFILFTSIFPIVYAIMSNVALYSAWRHFMFIYPGLVIIAAMGLNDVFSSLKKQSFQWAMLAVCALGLVRPVMWVIKNHPYGYAYFNEFSGGYKKVYYEYETDYWKITMKDALEWLMVHEPIMQAKDSVTISTDMDMFVKYYIKRHYPGAKVKVVLNDVPTRYGQPWSYSVFSKQFLTPEYLEKLYPPSQAIHLEKIDGLAECAVLKDTVRLDILARRAFEARDNALADSFLTVYFKQYSPDNVGLFGVWALIKAQLGKNEESLKYGSLGLQYNISPFSNYNALCGMGLAFANMKQYDKAVAQLNEAIKVLPENGMANNILSAVTRMRASGNGAPPPTGQPQ